MQVFRLFSGEKQLCHERVDDFFGLPQSGALPAPFGFTGELHSEGLIYLRARWYDPASGTFTSVDPFAGFARMPYSLHPYQYGYSAPTMWTDPSGLCPTCTPTPAPTPEPTPPPGTPTPPPPLPPTSPWPITGDALECVSGFFQQVAVNNSFGQVDSVAERPGEMLAMTVCRRVGDAASIAQGYVEFMGGGALVAGGIAACGTAVLCFVGAPAAVGGVAIAGHGAAVAVQGTWRLVVGFCAMMDSGSGSGGNGGSGNEQPPQPGTGPTKPLEQDPRLQSRSPADLAGNTPIKPIDQGEVSRSVVVRYAKMLLEPNFTWDSMPKIELIHANNGTFITDGHHRYLASRLAGLEIPNTRIEHRYTSFDWSVGTEWSRLRWEQ